MRNKTWQDFKIDTKQFFKRIVDSEKKSRKGFSFEKKFFEKCFDLHITSLGYAYDIVTSDKEDLFCEAFVRLSVKILHNAEAIRSLLYRGLYGSAFIIKRTLIFDAHMIWYLHFNPELISGWLNEKFMTYQDRKWRNKYSEATIIKDLETKGKAYNLAVSLVEFSFYSKPGHPSMFGVRFFQNEDGILAYTPKFSFQIGHQLFWSAIGLFFYPTQVLLLHFDKNVEGDERLKEIKYRYQTLMTEANSLGAEMVKFHKQFFKVRNLKDIVHT